ncbi:MAG: IS607 family transposase, partial [Limnospira sp. PMC 1252.20]|nr:IS607 family transposase [Limnospira sp. PMC 1252.20]MDT9318180.1 IS607 family transposase [Limnospira sp. PMC 1306.21]
MARYVKPKEAAQILRVHERTLRRWDDNGSIDT